MNAVEFAQLLQILAQIKREMQRMADAAEAQVAETKAMRAQIEAQREEQIRKEWIG